MGRYPGAVWRPLNKDTRPLTADDLVLQLHTMVGGLTGTDRYFRTVGTFSHFGIGGTWGADATAGLDGVVYQWGDTSRRAAASLDGNRRTISIETADNAARPIQPWTPKQCDAIVGIMVWAHKAHGIPLVLIPDSKPGRTGIGYHRLGCDPYRVDGGELWSSSYGKDCPTQARIDQIPGLIQRAQDIVNGKPEEDALTDEQMAELKDYIHRETQYAVWAVLKGGPNSVFKGLPAGEVTAVQQVEDKVDLLLAAHPAPAPEPTPEPTP